MTNNATKQANVKAGRGGVIPPVDRQFGKPNGNPRHNGAWKKEDTARYKLEKMMGMEESELMDVAKDKHAPLFERKLAVAINKADWKAIEHMINQVYGMPKQEIKQTNIELKPILPKPKKGKK